MDYYDEFFCPNCGAVLNYQSGFDPDLSSWTCTECGQTLYGDDIACTTQRFDGVVWYCDSCGAVLNKQAGFSDCYSQWTCSECGYENVISDDNIYPSEGVYRLKKLFMELLGGEDSNGEDEDECEREDEDEDADIHVRSYIQSKSARKRKKAKAVITLVCVLALAVTFFCHEIKCLTPVGYSRETLKGIDYNTVVQMLTEAGFSNVNTDRIPDLPFSRISEEYSVTEIELVWLESFTAKTRYPSNFPITITYHTLKPIPAAISSKEAKGQYYEDVKQQFIENGFVNVRTEPVYDLVVGWFAHEGDVKLVTIGEQTKFSSTDTFRPDVEIVIIYHMSKNEKTN